MMSTKTMRPPSRRVPWPNAAAPSDSSGSKRKERDDGFRRPKSSPVGPVTKLLRQDKTRSESGPTRKGSKSEPCHELLAGYLAHEFLTKGTLLGRKLGHSPSKQKETQEQKNERYVELTLLLKTEDGPYLFDVVNPTQLAHFLKL
ncbi:hypothetical protein VNO77_17442 [Canavalia gladiata]|uniref:Uncharacterized protein n=1 Tax=Canavalia gladiata TaxID=3824 RepID=A0AAN9QJD3_CANGL